MRDEVTYARDTTRSLPRKNPLFRIRKFDKSLKKNKLMTVEVFAVNLKVLVGKAGSRVSVTYENFQDAIQKLDENVTGNVTV